VLFLAASKKIRRKKMATNEIGEKIYYENDFAKVTNVRVTCRHVTAPVEKIDGVGINNKTESLCLRFAIMLVSLSFLLFLPVMPATLRLPASVILGLIAAMAAIWLYLLLKNYVELIVSVAGRRIVVLSSSIFDRTELVKLNKAITDAILDERKYCSMKEGGDEKIKFNHSETMRLKLMLEDYEHLKKQVESTGAKQAK
jgi:hypothetical protein